MTDIEAKLWEIGELFPADLISKLQRDSERIAYHVRLATRGLNPPAAVCDIGGGFGMFSLGCAAQGFTSVMVDNFQASEGARYRNEILGIHRRYGVRVETRNVVADGVDFPPESFDTITCFDSMEHWHHSPKGVFRQIVAGLKPGGVFILGVPNGVDLWKRITVPLGRAKWSAMQDYYEQEVFTGPVREPDVGDLRYIARDLGLVDVTIFGRNWSPFHRSGPRIVRMAARAGDRCMRLLPSLCLNI